MQGTQYVLTGFGDFLERRRISFVDPLPRSHVCCACGFVSSLSVRLPCGHVLCRPCKRHIASDAGTCPVEGVKFEEAGVASQTVKLSDLEQLRVYCINDGQRCDFVGKLAELPSHVFGCGYDEVKCDKCDGAVTRSAAVDHRRQCSVDLPLAGRTASPDEVAAVDGGSTGVVETLPDRASEEQVDREGVADDDANSSSVEDVTRYRTDSVRAKRTSSGELKVPDTSSAGPVSRYITPGPYRAASKPGVFVTLCKFDNIYEKYEELRSKDTVSAIAKGCTAGGYTFALKCTLSREEGEDATVEVYFSLYLGCGDWDNFVEWPFSKDVTVVLTHPKDKTKDVRFPIFMFKKDTVKKPAPTGATWNKGHRTIDGESWERIECEGFIHENALYVNVEFE
ncbi:hypothetical protein HPB49_009939 [Dermacentor silvarum]|uniref:Uncharacterized protein n=1 Tax=Dermacentor silvarum TaxID=543639 RepID=A0ACB8DIY5_DERSI|nr:hypothetical protein HPB49_009939 [Dermacentor silvarum]